jgi:hypothetical protein
MFEMYAAELNVSLTVVVMDVTGSSASNCAENRVEFVSITVVPADDPLVIGTKSSPGTTTQPAHQPTTESVTSEVGSTSQPNVAQADQTQQPENPFNPFDNEEEYVGVDDEHLVGVSIPEHIVEASSVAPEEEASNAAEDDMDPDDVKHLMQQEEEVADMDLHYNVADDPYNADIKVGALFPDMVTFRKAIRHHAVVADFEMANVKTDSTRFRANCSWADCPWRIHASKLPDQKVVMVPFFTCVSLMAVIICVSLIIYVSLIIKVA